MFIGVKFVVSIRTGTLAPPARRFDLDPGDGITPHLPGELSRLGQRAATREDRVAPVATAKRSGGRNG